MLRRLTLFSFAVVRTDPIALLRLENASATPRVILAQSSRAAIYLSPRDNVPSDRIMFEQAGAGISLRGTVRYYLAGVRRYSPYIIVARSFIRVRYVRALRKDSA